MDNQQRFVNLIFAEKKNSKKTNLDGILIIS